MHSIKFTNASFSFGSNFEDKLLVHWKWQGPGITQFKVCKFAVIATYVHFHSTVSKHVAVSIVLYHILLQGERVHISRTFSHTSYPDQMEPRSKFSQQGELPGRPTVSMSSRVGFGKQLSRFEIVNADFVVVNVVFVLFNTVPFVFDHIRLLSLFLVNNICTVWGNPPAINRKIHEENFSPYEINAQITL